MCYVLVVQWILDDIMCVCVCSVDLVYVCMYVAFF